MIAQHDEHWGQQQEDQRNADQVQQIANPPTQRRRLLRRQHDPPGSNVLSHQFPELRVNLRRRHAGEFGCVRLHVRVERITQGCVFPDPSNGPTTPVDVVRGRRHAARAHPGQQIHTGRESVAAGEQRAEPGRRARRRFREKVVAVAVDVAEKHQIQRIRWYGKPVDLVVANCLVVHEKQARVVQSVERGERDRTVGLQLARRFVHRVQEPPQFCFPMLGDRGQDEKTGLRRHGDYFEHFVACRLVVRHGIHRVTQFRELVIHPPPRAALVAERTMLWNRVPGVVRRASWRIPSAPAT